MGKTSGQASVRDFFVAKKRRIDPAESKKPVIASTEKIPAKNVVSVAPPSSQVEEDEEDDLDLDLEDDDYDEEDDESDDEEDEEEIPGTDPVGAKGKKAQGSEGSAAVAIMVVEEEEEEVLMEAGSVVATPAPVQVIVLFFFSLSLPIMRVCSSIPLSWTLSFFKRKI